MCPALPSLRALFSLTFGAAKPHLPPGERLCPPGSTVAGEGQPHARRSEAAHLSAVPAFLALRLSQVPGKQAEWRSCARAGWHKPRKGWRAWGGSMPTGSGREAGRMADAATLRARVLSADATCPRPSWHLGWGDGGSPGGGQGHPGGEAQICYLGSDADPKQGRKFSPSNRRSAGGGSA